MTLSEATKVFSGRFFLIGYLPTQAALVFVLLLIAAGAPGEIDFGAAWRKVAGLGAGEAVLVVLGVILVSLVTHPLQLPLVRLLEGHWPGRLARLPRRHQERRRVRLERAATLGGAGPEAERTRLAEDDLSEAEIQRAGVAGTRLRQRFPSASEVRPSALGNVLAAAEERAGSAYGWDAVVAWPRLYPLLSPQVRTIVDDRRDTLDAVARLSATAAVTGLVAVVLLAGSGGWPALALVPLGLSVIAYHAAVHAALAYGESLDMAFDLHRFDLLTALRLPMPGDRAEEKAANEALCDFWRQGAPVPLTYEHRRGE